MKKVLPINFDPYVRTYTHHGYHHSVISTHDKVAYKETDDVARLKIKNYSEYVWNSQIEGMRYEIIQKDVLKFYGNKWNINMNAAFWRKCNTFEDIEIIIDTQLYSNVWASIFVFLSSDTKVSMTDFDKAYNLVFGNFSKDGIYYKDQYLTHTILCASPTLPIIIHLKKTETKVILIYKEINQNEKKITLNIDEFNGPNERIGFGVNLRCNSYYEWLFSNYINVFVDLNQGIPIDYLCDNHKNWNCHTYNHFIDFNIETEKDIKVIGYSLIDYIKKMIDINRYIEIMINDNIHLKKNDNNYFHSDLIYGYDDDEGCFYLLFYKHGKVTPVIMSYVDFLSSRNYIENRIIYIYKYNPAYEYYRITSQHLLQVFKEYRDSRNISYFEPQHDNHIHFGINGIKSLLSDTGQKVLLADIRVSHLLYERSRCNYERIDYLYCRNFFNTIDYDKISILAKKVCNQTLIIRNLVLKKICGGRVYDSAVINYFKEYIAFESELTDEIIQALESWDPN